MSYSPPPPSNPSHHPSYDANTSSSASFSHDDSTATTQKRLSQTSTSSASKRTKTHIGPWRLGRTLGRGSSGRVRLAKHNVTGQLAAVKIVPKSLVSGSSHDTSRDSTNTNHHHNHDSQRDAAGFSYGIEREVIIMKLIEHPNVMALYDVWENKGELYLVLEYIEGGELFDYLIRKGRLEEREALHYFRQIINGVDYCHHFNICHRDLKPENLLLDKNRNIKIADFGMAALETSDRMLETSCGSPHYASPEIVSGKNYHGGPSDIWSCGIILFALLTGHLPFDDENIRKLLFKVQAGKFHMPSDLSLEAQDLISRMLCVDPDQRIAMSDILNHPLLKKYPSRRAARTYDQVNKPLLPMSVSRPVNFRDDIDPEILKNLQTLWHGADREAVIKRLLSPEQNSEKTFYCLLMKYRHDHLEDGSKSSFALPVPGMSRSSSSRQIIKASASSQHLHHSHHHHHHHRRSSHSRQGRASRHSRTGSKSSIITASSSHKRGVSFSSLKQRTKSSTSIRSNMGQQGSLSRSSSPPPPMPHDAVEMQMQASVEYSQDYSQFSYPDYDQVLQHLQNQQQPPPPPPPPPQIPEETSQDNPNWAKEVKRTSSEFASMLEQAFDFSITSNGSAEAPQEPTSAPIAIPAQTRRTNRVVSDPLPYSVDPSNLDATILASVSKSDPTYPEKRRAVSEFIPQSSASSLDPYTGPQTFTKPNTLYSPSAHSSLDHFPEPSQLDLHDDHQSPGQSSLLNAEYLLPMIFEEDDRFADAIEEEMEMHFNSNSDLNIQLPKPTTERATSRPRRASKSRRDSFTSQHSQPSRRSQRRVPVGDYRPRSGEPTALSDDSIVELDFQGPAVTGVAINDTSLQEFDSSNESASVDEYASAFSGHPGDATNNSAISGETSRLRISGLLKTESFKARGSFSNFKTPSMIDIVEQRAVPEYQLNAASAGELLSQNANSSDSHPEKSHQESRYTDHEQSMEADIHANTTGLNNSLSSGSNDDSMHFHVANANHTDSSTNTVVMHEGESSEPDAPAVALPESEPETAGMPKFMESPKMNTYSFMPTLPTQQAQVYQQPTIMKLGGEDPKQSRSTTLLRKFSLNPKRQAPAPPTSFTSSGRAVAPVASVEFTLTQKEQQQQHQPKLIKPDLPTPPPSEPQSRVASGSSQVSAATTAVEPLTIDLKQMPLLEPPQHAPVRPTAAGVAETSHITAHPRTVSATVVKSQPPRMQQLPSSLPTASIDPSPVKQNWFMKMLNMRSEPDLSGAAHRARGRVAESTIMYEPSTRNAHKFSTPGTPTIVSPEGNAGYKSSKGYYSLLTAQQVRRHIVDILKSWERYGVSGIKIVDGGVSSNGAKAIIIKGKVSSRNALSVRSTRFRVEIEAHELRSYVAPAPTKAPTPAPAPAPAPVQQQSKNVFKRLFSGSKSSKSEAAISTPAPMPLKKAEEKISPAPQRAETSAKVTSILIIQERGSLSTFTRFLKEMEQALEARNAISGTSSTAALGHSLTGGPSGSSRPMSGVSAQDSYRTSIYSGRTSRPASGCTTSHEYEDEEEDEEYEAEEHATTSVVTAGLVKSSQYRKEGGTTIYHHPYQHGSSSRMTNTSSAAGPATTTRSQGLGIVV